MSRTGVIGSVGVRGQRQRLKRKRQLTWRQRARVSAQQVRAKIFKNGCAIDRAAMSHFSCRMNKRSGVFVAWLAAWRYGGFWIARRVIGNGVGVGGVNK